MQPKQEKELHRVVEGDNSKDKIGVHVEDSEGAEAHPIGQPGLVVLDICVGLQCLQTLKEGIEAADHQNNLIVVGPGEELIKLPDEDE